MKDDINRDFLSQSLPYIDVKEIDPTLYIYESLFVLFSFLILEGVASMIYFSVYHIIRKEDIPQTVPASIAQVSDNQ